MIVRKERWGGVGHHKFGEIKLPSGAESVFDWKERDRRMNGYAKIPLWKEAVLVDCFKREVALYTTAGRNDKLIDHLLMSHRARTAQCLIDLQVKRTKAAWVLSVMVCAIANHLQTQCLEQKILS